MTFDFLNRRPIVIVLAGSNGAGKSTFYESHLAGSGLRFINADTIADELAITPYQAAEVAAALRTAMTDRGESFIFETVLSDPVGEKVEVLTRYIANGYEVVLIFIEIANPITSIERVSIRVVQGGHDVPDDQLRDRFERTKANLARAIEQLPHVIVYDNSDLNHPYRLSQRYHHGKKVED